MARISCRASVSMAWRSVRFFSVAVLIDRKLASRVRSRIDAMHRKDGAHARGRALGIVEQRGGIGEAEELGEVDERARALLTADHGEVALVTVEIGHEDDTRFVEPRRRLEDVARQRHGWRQDVVEGVVAPSRELAERGGGGGRDGVEDAEEGVARV